MRSSEVRTAIGSGDIALAARLLGRPHAVVGVTEAGWQGSVVAFELPVALPPDGAWDVEVASGGESVAAVAHIDDGSLVLAGVPAADARPGGVRRGVARAD